MKIKLIKNKPCEGRKKFNTHRVITEVTILTPSLEVILERIAVLLPDEQPRTIFHGAMEAKDMSRPLSRHHSLYSRRFVFDARVSPGSEILVTFRAPEECVVEWGLA